MTTNYYFPDTTFFMDHLDFDQLVYDLKPYRLVICKPVLDELDGLKKSDGLSGPKESNRGYKSREVSRKLEDLQMGKRSLPKNGIVDFYLNVNCNSKMTGDEQIIYALRKYAARHKGKGNVVFLSSDRNQRIKARALDSIYQIADPIEWQNQRKEERQYLTWLGEAVSKDDKVKQAYEERIQLEHALTEQEQTCLLEGTRDLSELLDEVRQNEKLELERYVAKKITSMGERKQQSARLNRNKYWFTLFSFFQQESFTLPVKDKDQNRVGEITLKKHWRYLNFQDKITTVHISAKIAGAVSPTGVISAQQSLPYHIKNSLLIFPQENRRYSLFAGSWKILLDIAASIAPAPYDLPNGEKGSYAVFKKLEMTVDAVELTAVEISELKQQEEKKEKTSKSGGHCIIAALIVGLLSLCSCYIAMTLLWLQ
jgi:hypothetical protein